MGKTLKDGLQHLKVLIGGGVTWYFGRKNLKEAQWFCLAGSACALEPGFIGFYSELFQAQEPFVRGIAVHELAHKIHFTQLCPTPNDRYCYAEPTGLPGWSWHFLTKNAWAEHEYWAEAVAIYVYETEYMSGPGRGDLFQAQRNFIKGVLEKP